MSINFTKAELEHIYVVVRDNYRDGDYYGRKDYWDKRCQSIINKILGEMK